MIKILKVIIKFLFNLTLDEIRKKNLPKIVLTIDDRSIVELFQGLWLFDKS